MSSPDNTWVHYDPDNPLPIPNEKDRLFFICAAFGNRGSSAFCSGYYAKNSFHLMCGAVVEDHFVLCWMKPVPSTDDLSNQPVEAITLFVNKADQLADLAGTKTRIAMDYLSTIVHLVPQRPRFRALASIRPDTSTVLSQAEREHARMLR